VPVRKVIIDTDPGQDDAVAVLLALRWSGLIGSGPRVVARNGLLAVMSLLAACGQPIQGAQPDSPNDICILVAADYGRGFTVVGAFLGDLGDVKDLIPEGGGSERWPGVDSAHPAIICYIDGPFAKSPPRDSSNHSAEPYGRAIVVVINGESELIADGYPDAIDVPAP
jgi:hypothetical protein